MKPDMKIEVFRLFGSRGRVRSASRRLAGTVLIGLTLTKIGRDLVLAGDAAEIIYGANKMKTR